MKQFRNSMDRLYEEVLNEVQSTENFMKDGRSNEKHFTADMVDPEQLKKGIDIEYEHTADPKIAEKIALDHFSEKGGKWYYILLDLMESFMEHMADMDDSTAENVVMEIEKLLKGMTNPTAVEESVIDPLDGGLGKNTNSKVCKDADLKISKTKSKKDEKEEDDDEVEEEAGISTADVAIRPRGVGRMQKRDGTGPNPNCPLKKKTNQ